MGRWTSSAKPPRLHRGRPAAGVPEYRDPWKPPRRMPRRTRVIASRLRSCLPWRTTDTGVGPSVPERSNSGTIRVVRPDYPETVECLQRERAGCNRVAKAGWELPGRIPRLSDGASVRDYLLRKVPPRNPSRQGTTMMIHKEAGRGDSQESHGVRPVRTRQGNRGRKKE